MATALVLSGITIAGCGGDDSTIQSVSTTSTTSTAAVSTEEFITAADARCAEANSAIANLSTDAAATAATVEQQLDITEQTLNGLQALGDPEDPDGSLADFYSAMEDQISTLEEQQQALTSGDSATYDSLEVQLEQAQSEAETAGATFGFEECGQQGSSLPSDSTTSTTPSGGTVTPTTTVPAPATTTPAPAPAPAPAPVTPPTGGTGGTPGTGGSGGGGGNSGGISP